MYNTISDASAVKNAMDVQEEEAHQHPGGEVNSQGTRELIRIIRVRGEDTRTWYVDHGIGHPKRSVRGKHWKIR